MPRGGGMGGSGRGMGGSGGGMGRGKGGGPWWRALLGRGGGKMVGRGRPDFCICPACGFVVSKEPGSPCFLMPCPRCGSPMARKFVSGE